MPRLRPPLVVIVSALVALLAVLATLQYRWLGRISDAERDSRRSMLGARASALASDFDKELTLAYVLFQFEPLLDGAASHQDVPASLAARYDRWQSTSRFPRLIREYFLASVDAGGAVRLERFDPSARSLAATDWPGALAGVRAGLSTMQQNSAGPDGQGTLVVRRLPAALWDEVPALVVPMPLVLIADGDMRSERRPGALVTFAVLWLDREYIVREVLPTLTAQHLRGLGDGVDYEVAIVGTDGRDALYRSTPAFERGPNATVDAEAHLFSVRLQEFAQMASDIRRFSMALPLAPGGHALTAVTRPGRRGAAPGSPQTTGHIVQHDMAGILEQERPAAVRARAIVTSIGAAARPGSFPARWRVLVKHPSGSLEAAVASTRRRNLLVSSSILAVLGASIGLLVLSLKRSQAVVRQQMEFVAAVSHELRTPLAVIRSAGDNLAAGVIGDGQQIRKYGELVRAEGRRLSEMVEQILEFAGIQSGQRHFDPAPVDVAWLLGDLLSASGTLLDAARVQVDVDLQPGLPPVLGSAPALRRVFQNLLGNAIKYGADGRWIGVRARESAGEVQITIEDRGLGISPSEQARIFEPFYRAANAVVAQIQGTGLGLTLAQRIVQAHGGRLTVRSSPGAGSEFTVHLAAAPESAVRREACAAEAPHHP